MVSSSRAKHAIHVACLFAIVLAFQLNTGGVRFCFFGRDSLASLKSNGIIRIITIYALHFVSLLHLPQRSVGILGCALVKALGV